MLRSPVIIPAPAGNRMVNLELLRVTAAFGVFAAHSLGHVLELQPNSFFGYLQWLGREWVLVFFILSGVVNALSDEMHRGSASNFLVRRMRRILPIYLAMSAVGWSVDYALGFPPPTAGDVFGTLFFCVDPTTEGFPHGVFTNAVIWSLTYEVWFYLMFAFTIAIGRKGYLAWSLLGSLATTGLFFFPLGTAARTISSILVYSLFWLLGWSLVRHHGWWRFRASAAFIGAACGVGLMARPVRMLGHDPDALYHAWLCAGLVPLFLGALGRISPRIWPDLRESLLLLFAYVAGAGALLADGSKSSITVAACLSLPWIGLAAGPAVKVALGKLWSFSAACEGVRILGQYSYALYLCHMPFCFIVSAHVKNPWLSVAVVLGGPLLLTWVMESKIHPWILAAWDALTRERRVSAIHPA